jgi:peptide/nickel transport system substrate-binding protein
VLADQQIDGMQELNLNQYSTVLKMPYLKIARADSAQTGLLRMLMVHPLCQDPKLRKAMRLVLDNQKLLQIGYNGLGIAAEHHHVCQTHPDYAATAPFRANIDEAKELMRQAGYSRGFNTEILCRQNVEWEMLTTQAIAQMWKEINITVTVRPQPSLVFNQAINSNDYPFAFVAWPHRPLGIMTLNMSYRSYVPGNITQFSNIRLDEMLDKAGGDIKSQGAF